MQLNQSVYSKLLPVLGAIFLILIPSIGHLATNAYLTWIIQLTLTICLVSLAIVFFVKSPLHNQPEESQNDVADFFSKTIAQLENVYSKDGVIQVVQQLVGELTYAKAIDIAPEAISNWSEIKTELDSKQPISFSALSPTAQASLKSALGASGSSDSLVIPLRTKDGLELLIVVGVAMDALSQTQLDCINTLIAQARIILDRCKPYDDVKQSYERTLKLAEDMKAQAAYATLTKGIAHEIKNPLGQLKLWADIALEDLNNKESIQKFANTTSMTVTRLKELVETMLKYKDVDSGKKEFFDYHDVIQDCLKLNEPTCQLDNYKIKIVKNFGANLAKIFGDRLFTYFSVMNLMVNAMEHTPKGGTITLETTQENYEDPNGNNRDGIVLRVSDTGSGIAKENLDKIFDPFFTTGESNSPNVGLGLSLVFRVATANAGKVTVESEEGKGTTFRLYFPIQS